MGINMGGFDYEEYVLECYQKNKDQDIHNASTENALLLFKTLLKKAIKNKEDVRIISGSLLASFYNELITPMQGILNNNNSVNIIVEGDIDDKEHNGFHKSFKDYIVDARVKFKGLPNFILVGDNSYRYEEDKNSHKALANFNNKSVGSFMQEMFDDLLEKINKNTKT